MIAWDPVGALCKRAYRETLRFRLSDDVCAEDAHLCSRFNILFR